MISIAAYDFLNSDENGFNLNIWYNSTYNNDTGFVEVALVRVPRTVNAVRMLTTFVISDISNCLVVF